MSNWQKRLWRLLHWSFQSVGLACLAGVASFTLLVILREVVLVVDESQVAVVGWIFLIAVIYAGYLFLRYVWLGIRGKNSDNDRKSSVDSVGRRSFWDRFSSSW